jgi:hypothetical protein
MSDTDSSERRCQTASDKTNNAIHQYLFWSKSFFGFNASTIGTYKTISQKETVARNGNNKNGTGRTGSNNGLFELALKLCQDRMKKIPIDVEYMSMIDILGLGQLRHLSSIQINQEKISHQIG